MAAKQFAAGNHKMAVKMYTDAIRIAPRQHTLYSNRSAASCLGGHYAEAFEDACKCIDLMPTWPKGYVRKGAALHGMDRWVEAVKAYEEGLKFDPTSEALRQGIDDARRRSVLAGGEWKWMGHERSREDGQRLVSVPIAVCGAPAKGVCVLDQGGNDDAGARVTVFNHDLSYTKCVINGEQMINRAGVFGQPKVRTRLAPAPAASHSCPRASVLVTP